MSPILQEFLILPSDGFRRIFGVAPLPPGTFVGRDAQRLRVVGPVWVRPPRPELTETQWQNWCARLEAAGFTVEVGPFWTTTPTGESRPLEEVKDEFLRSAR